VAWSVFEAEVDECEEQSEEERLENARYVWRVLHGEEESIRSWSGEGIVEDESE
jgi:hypothetical protein